MPHLAFRMALLPIPDVIVLVCSMPDATMGWALAQFEDTGFIDRVF
jgi:hypothetical protein